MITLRKRTFVAGFLWILTSASLASGAPFKTSEERVPKQVREAIAKQLELYFAKQDFAGVPLLDSKIDWNFLANWPDEFTFSAERYVLRIRKWIPQKVQIERADVKTGMIFNASYILKGADHSGRFSPMAVWVDDGSVHYKSVRVWKKRSYRYEEYLTRKSDPNIRSALRDNYTSVFICTFYRTGDLYFFLKKEPERTGEISYFDRKGRLVGGPGLKWEGREVDSHTFLRLADELFKPDVKPPW
jgi:hypothetical protein